MKMLEDQNEILIRNLAFFFKAELGECPIKTFVKVFIYNITKQIFLQKRTSINGWIL